MNNKITKIPNVIPRKLKKISKERVSIKHKFKQSERRLGIPGKRLVEIANNNEDVRHKLAIVTEKLRDSYSILDKKVVERTAELKKAYATLEQKVRERTKDLEDSNIATQNILEDLSVEKQNTDKLLAKENAILNSIGEGFIATDEKGIIIFINSIAEEMLGLKKSEAIGNYYFNYLKMQDEKELFIPISNRPLTRTLANNSVETVTVNGATRYLVRRDKTKFPVAGTSAPIILDNKAIGAIIIFRDITHEKEIDKAKTEFVSLASHQLRTPLTSISWSAEMLLNGDFGKIEPKQMKYLEVIQHGTRKMIELVGTLLNVSRIELGTFKYRQQLINIVNIAQKQVEELEPRIIEKKIKFSKKICKNIPKFKADPELIGMVIQNILVNAVKYTPKNGKIDFSVVCDDKKNVIITVSDTGIGIPKSQQNLIFTKLFRADNARTGDIDGTGLGLYIVKSVIENSGGKIWFKSIENKGTTFFVKLPLQTEVKN